MARLTAACIIEDLDEQRAKDVGALLAKARRADIVDAVVVLGAAARGDAVVTSDRADLVRLIEAAGADIRIIDV